MPAKHKYKCLNPQCPGTGRKDDTGLFIAMNAPTPACPCCGAIKVEDWGDAPHDAIGPVRSKPQSFGKAGAGSRIDSTLKGLASSYGLSDINNNGGRAAKAQAPAQQGEFGNRNYFGVDCPIGRAPVTVSGNAGIPVKAPPGSRFPGERAIPSHMRQIQAEHKG